MIMLRVIEFLGLCAPVVGAGLVLYYRRRMGAALGYALIAAVLALLGSGIGMLTERAMWFGGGGTHGMTERMEFGAGLRNLFLAGAWLLLLVAVRLRREVRA
ncbi:hypothetical protein AB0L82_28315 [Nocardia sp. NPDC052001]|uniref:hypothetical protein n=1 Tax=Nocardia sp. NPDC052001 TaxID=3154853 RepID=UPI00342F2E29